MLIPALLYNLAMAVVDAGALIHLRRKRTLRAWFEILLGAGFVAIVLAAVLGRGLFGPVLLAAFGVFLHATLLLIGSTILLWKTHRKSAIAFAVASLALLGIAVDAFLIEPHWLEVSRFEIASEKLEKPVRIVVIADLQTDRIGDYERMALRRAIDEKPDLLLFAGDYLQASEPRRTELHRELNALLRETAIPEKTAAFAVGGNVDDPAWPKSFEGLPVTVAELTTSFTPRSDVRVSCLSMLASRSSSTKVPGDADRFHIVLGHCPDFAFAGLDADLLLAGHTHGGQVRLPIIGPPVIPSGVPRSWAAGATDLPTGGTLVVSRGVGMERGSAPRLRFLCRPEIVVIDVLPERRTAETDRNPSSPERQLP